MMILKRVGSLCGFCLIACLLSISIKVYAGTLLTTSLMPSVAARVGGPAMPVGMFESHEDVGAVLHAGSVEYSAATHKYTVSGSGENMWFARDAFHFAW